VRITQQIIRGGHINDRTILHAPRRSLGDIEDTVEIDLVGDLQVAKKTRRNNALSASHFIYVYHLCVP
jgi:hypothetical protein